MFDPVKRQPYVNLFDFEKFYKFFQHLIFTDGSIVAFTMEQFICDHPELWIDYDIAEARAIAGILEDEVYEAYNIQFDFEGKIILPSIMQEVSEVELKEPTIRDLAKEYLESCDKPQSYESVLKFVNDRRINWTELYKLKISLKAKDVRDIFITFENGKVGLCDKKYRKEDMQNVIEFPFEPDEVQTDLRSQTFELRYSSKRANHPIDFFTKALSNSSHLDIGLGYFSSASFNVLACGFAHFITNGGLMRMYINPNLTEEDYNLLKNKDVIGFRKRLIESYERLFKVLSHRDELFFKCLAFLIQEKRIEIKIAVLKEGGIAHEKFGIFTDSQENEVAFTGSMNLTAAGLTKNIESVDSVCSWTNDEAKQRIAVYHEDFNNIWEERNPDVTIFSSYDFCNVLMQHYPKTHIDDLVRLEKTVIQDLPKDIPSYFADRPHFPSKFKRPFPYQEEAYQNWCNRGKQGIFAMATGTGKTITSLNCALEEYYNDEYYHLIILVPSLALVEQWGEEAANFNFRNIITVSSDNNDWRTKVVDVMNKLNRGKDVNYVIISTYQSFVVKDFQILLPRISTGAILIADEAHNIGSKQVRQAFRALTISRRIALSATPQRVYDEEGTKEIETFFNDTYPYTYSFSMRRAIQEERLMSYMYFPRLAYLEEDEMSKYVHITRQLLQLYNEQSGSFSDPDKAHTLLMQRKNVLHKARNKMREFRNIITEIGEDKLKYCFVYSAAGKRTTIDGKDDEVLDEEILKQMLAITKQVFPSVRCNSYTSNDSKSLRKQKLDAFAAGQIDVLFAKNCLDEGVDVPRAEYGIFTSSTGNPRQFIQRRGRLIRKHKDKRFAYIYDIIVTPNFRSPQYDRKWWKMEKHLVEGEMRRVANFACLASNYYAGAMSALQDVVSFYEIDLDGMILNEE